MNKFVDAVVNKLNTEDTIKFTDKDIFKEVKRWIPTGCPELEYNLGVLGLPPGIVEVAGPSRSGKTTFSLHVAREFQEIEPEGVVIILSSEKRDNKLYAQRIGIDTDSVIIIKSKYVEDLFFRLEIVRKNLQKAWEDAEKPGTIPILIIWDSVGGTLSRSEHESFDENVKALEKSMEKGTKFEMSHANPGAFAKNAKMMIKSILSKLDEEGIVLIAINHTMDNIGGGPMAKGKKSTGGEWVQYFPIIRLQTALTGHEKVDDEEVAQTTQIKIVKNDFGSRRKTEIEILLGVGIVLSENDIAYAVNGGILKKEGKTGYSFLNGKVKWSSKRSFYQLYEDQPKMMRLLYKRVLSARHKETLAEKNITTE